MPIKKDKRKKKITLLKQKQKQKQKQSQQVVINLGDLMKKHKPRAKPLVPPKPKQPHELILTRVINPTVMPQYQHHNLPTPPVELTRDGLEPQKYVPENYKPVMNKDFLDKMGQQPTPFHRREEQEPDPVFPILEAETIPQRQPRRRQDDPTLIAEKEAKALRKLLKQEEMERRRQNEADLMKRGGYKSQDE